MRARVASRARARDNERRRALLRAPRASPIRLRERAAAPRARRRAARFDELDQFGLPLEVENPLTRMCRAECLLALYILRCGEGGAPMSIDFVDAEKLGVLRNAYD